MVSDPQRRLLALCAIRVDKQSPDWSVLARQAADPGGLDRLYDGIVDEAPQDPPPLDPDRPRRMGDAEKTSWVLHRALADLSDAHDRVDAELQAAESVGAHLVTVMDDTYPANLSLIYDLPPFLFIRGHVGEQDIRSVAVVGTRNADDVGLKQAQKMARLLTERDVTVVSGLAAGIDTAAHTAALEGGRTIAVLGTGITRAYPAKNRALQEEIATGGRGAVVSQFWPTSGSATWTFPRRNVVTSGISQGTVVIQASSTSGAKMQARIALQHGKRVWLIRSLVAQQEWARMYVKDRGAEMVNSVDEVIDDLAEPRRIVKKAMQTQLELAL